jgi:replication-associated recombination protein RarA
VLRGSHWYEPTQHGYEKTIAERIAWWEELKRKAGA